MESPLSRGGNEYYRELARNLCAAYMAHEMMLTSIDEALQRYVPEQPGQFWVTFAKVLADRIAAEREGPSGPPAGLI